MTLKDIEASFATKGQAPPQTLNDILQKLKSDGVVEFKLDQQSKRYLIIR